jgi:Arc/MetJ-type ribon-helix-helix transcriptional regulator
MQLITVHLPERTLELIDSLVKAGFYLNRSEAIRLILTRAAEEEAALLGKIGLPELEKPAPVIKEPPEMRKLKHSMVSLRVPKALNALIRVAAKRLGFRSKSELIRVSVISFILKRYHEER